MRKISLPPEFDPPDRPASNESLYRLIYRGLSYVQIIYELIANSELLLGTATNAVVELDRLVLKYVLCVNM